MAKILIVDDSPAQVLKLSTLIENWGHVLLAQKMVIRHFKLPARKTPTSS